MEIVSEREAQDLVANGCARREQGASVTGGAHSEGVEMMSSPLDTLGLGHLWVPGGLGQTAAASPHRVLNRKVSVGISPQLGVEQGCCRVLRGAPSLDFNMCANHLGVHEAESSGAPSWPCLSESQGRPLKLHL